MKLLKKFSDRVKSGKSPCPDIQIATIAPSIEGPTLALVIVVDGVGIDITSQPLVMEN